MKLWWSNAIYYPSFEVFTTSWIGAVDTNSYYEGWTITESAAPATSVVDVPYANAEPRGLTMGGNIRLAGNWLSGDGGNEGLFVDNSGLIGIGTTNPATALHVNGSLTVTNGDLLMPGRQITVNKLNVSTIDPLYSIYGTNYASFAASIVGGVKEEVTGKINVNKKVGTEYEYVINFDTVKKGSDLWVWRQVIDFNKDGVEAQITPYGKFANTYYNILGNKIIIRADRPAEVSYRFIGKRFDWKQWPTIPINQTEKAGLIIN